MIGRKAICGDDDHIVDSVEFIADEFFDGSERCLFGCADAIGIEKDFGVILARFAACFFTFYANNAAPGCGAKVFAFIIEIGIRIDVENQVPLIAEMLDDLFGA